jgi:hypothetical protein
MNTSLPSLSLKLAGSIPLRIAHAPRQASWNSPRASQRISKQSRRFFSKPRWKDAQYQFPLNQPCMVYRRVSESYSLRELSLRNSDFSLLSSSIRKLESVQSIRRIERCVSGRHKEGLLWAGEEIPSRHQQRSQRERQVYGGASSIRAAFRSKETGNIRCIWVSCV